MTPRDPDLQHEDMDLAHRIESLEDADDANRISLRDYVDLRFKTSEDAIKLARDILDTKLKEENAVREQLRTQKDEFMPRAEYCTAHELLTNAVSDLQKFRFQAEGRAGMNSVIGVVALVIALVDAYIRWKFH